MKEDEENLIHRQRKNLDFGDPLDYARMMEYLEDMIERYSFLSFSYLGESIMGRGIPMLTLGEGDRSFLYVGAHRAGAWMMSILLLRWINEACELYRSKGKIFHYNAEYLFSTRRIVVVPMLNPDGVEYHLHGVSKGNILYDRLRSMNEGSDDFSAWQANARGVDLSHNYGVGFAAQKIKEKEAEIFCGAPIGFSGECSESEPEVGSLCNYLRYHREIRMVLDLQTSGETVSYHSDGNSALHTESIAQKLAEFCGYPLKEKHTSNACGSLIDWCTVERKLPAFSVACGKGEKSLNLEDSFYLYMKLRKMFFLSLTLI